MRIDPKAPTLSFALALAAGAAAAAAPPTIATLVIPGHARLAAIARNVLQVQAEVAPDFASQSGLVDDAMRVPSFAPAQVARATRRLHADMAALRALPWRRWSVDEQIDVRWTYANAQRIDRELNVERLYLHRPGAWLEGLSNNLLSIVTYAPARTDALAAVTAGIPAVVAEMDAICKPTQTDAEITRGLVDGTIALLKANPTPPADAAIEALAGYAARLAANTGARPFAVIGASNYAWRLKHANLLPWSPVALRTLAQARLAQVDKQIAALTPRLAPAAPLPPELEQQAVDLDQARLLALYDQIQVRNRAAIEAAGFVTIPPGVGPIRARVTPDAMVPRSGDGGRLNPPPPFIDDNVGWWNVEHFDPAMPLADREDDIRDGALSTLTGMGPYAAHEGLPGHHLQLSIARLNPDPLRNLFEDPVQNEGWALYAEQEMWEQGGLGPSVEAHVNTLKGWRSRIRRVVYDVNVETGVWTLQQAAEWKWKAANKPGEAKVDPDLLRSINWPAQLICYFAGKEQILALKAAAKKKWGVRYTERRFHDELLALGSVPYVFARAKMLGERVPGF